MEIFHKIGDRAKVVGEKAKVVGGKAGETAKVVGEKAKVVGERAGVKARDVGDLAKGIARKSSELVEVTKLKYDISKLEKEMENNLTALGQLQYRQFRGEEGMAAEIERLLTATAGIDDHILSLQNEVERLQPKPPVCGGCQEEPPPGANFCPRCGKKLE
ncbi:MAG TPA: zinc ribbon domain-containing protein [Spirochaetia bacterium]|nr:zinc ribbon domain-containing protein [Spirochaetia bacterium]